MSAEDQNRGRKETRNPGRSYVTCSSKRQREIEEEWDSADQANRGRYAQTEDMCFSKSEHDDGRHWRSALKKPRSIDEDDLSQHWLCDETDPFTARIRYFKVPKRTRMPTNVKTYDGTGDPEDHLKIFQSAAKIERWAMQGSANYEMLRKAFLRNFSQQKKYIKDPVEIHHIKQREGESTEAFMKRFKAESMHVNGAPECMRISGFMHGVTNPDLIKRLNDNIPNRHGNTMRRATNQASTRGQTSRTDINQIRRQDRFTPLIKTPKILAMETVKFKAPPPMTGPAENQNKNKFCEFHRDKGHNTDECIHLRKQIEEAVKSGYEGQENPIVIEAKVKGHLIHRMYVDEGSASEVLYEHCFNRLRPEVKSRMIPNTTPLLGFSGEISKPLGRISLVLSLGDGEHSKNAMMNFMIVRSPSPYNGIIGRPGLRKIQAVPSTAHGMLKFPVEGGIVTIRSNAITPAECRMVAGASKESPPIEPVVAEGIKVAIHHEYPEQIIIIGESLSKKGKMELCDMLRNNLDVFAWKPSNMTGVPRSIAEHRLNIREGCPPIRQKKEGRHQIKTKPSKKKLPN
ncbi:reverse transcriptase domain-containing protein [Tanacetum coccineum]